MKGPIWRGGKLITVNHSVDDLVGRPALADGISEVDHQLDGRLARSGKGLGLHHSTDTDVHLQEGVHVDLRGDGLAHL
jgi:hypothetical protein